jgi:hypothetical protein
LSKEDELALARKVTFHYEKSPQLRAVHASGAYGGLTPELGIYMGLFNEHAVMPEETTNTVTETGQVGTELERKPKARREPGHAELIRQIEVEVYLSVETARAIRGWLDDKIRQIESAKALQGKSETEG